MSNSELVQKVLKIVCQIPAGSFLSYKQVAKLAGNEKAYRAVANLMKQNKDSKIPCHRVIKNNNEVGGYRGSFQNEWQKAALLLKEGAIGVIPTDTIYGLCGSALNKKTIETIYRLKRRKANKPMIILIASVDDLEKFDVKPESWQQKILNKVWPGKISIILPCPSENFSYLHRGTKSLAFRMPANEELLKILKISGPLVAPSANWEGSKPAETINQAKKYFGKKVFYYNKGRIQGAPSAILDLTRRPIKVLRKGMLEKEDLSFRAK